MKLLFGENLSRKLVARLLDLYPGSTHVQQLELHERPDSEIWEHAKRSDLTIVSTDSDFFELATTLGPPPKVVWLRRWRHPAKDAEAILRREVVRTHDFGRDPEAGILVVECDETLEP